MNDPRVRISSQAEINPDHYRFVRDTGLPRGTFDQRSDRWGDLFAVVISVGGFLLALYMGWGGR